jgi:hypothetical protein
MWTVRLLSISSHFGLAAYVGKHILVMLNARNVFFSCHIRFQNYALYV